MTIYQPSLTITLRGIAGEATSSAPEIRRSSEVQIIGMPGTGKTLSVNKSMAVLRGSAAVDFFRDFSDLMGEKDPKKWMDSFDGRKNMEVWSNMGYPPVIKRGNWKSPNGNIIYKW